MHLPDLVDFLMRLPVLMSCLFLGLAAQSASAQSTSPIQEAGVDLEFACISEDGGKTVCQPAAGPYGRYARLANWKFAGGIDATQDCQYQTTYGYGKQAPWVAGDCHAVFRAPNLRYGDEYNAQRLEDSRQGSASSISGETLRNEGPECFFLCWQNGRGVRGINLGAKPWQQKPATVVVETTDPADYE